MNITERFLQYISIDTESDENNIQNQPSTKEQWKLAQLLKEELIALGAQAEISDTCIVYAHFAPTEGYEDKPAFGCIAHMDTVTKGKNIKASVIENYNGKDVLLTKEAVLSVEKNPHLPSLTGRSLIVTDGQTILGADDKAGIAAIMNMCEVMQTSNMPHGKVCIAFTPDEEIGNGVNFFDLQKFGADYAVTVDGGAENEIEYENFNAAHVRVSAKGVNTHPGSAKGVMINASTLLCEFQNRLPKAEVPEKTEGKEGFFHLIDLKSNVEEGYADYLIREFDKNKFADRKKKLQEIATALNQEIAKDVISIEIVDSYYNMAEIVEKNPEILQNIEQAIRNVGLEPEYLPIRGGTDGCRLSYEGLPCPNLGAGGYMFHSIYEHCTTEGMENASRVLIELVKIYSRKEAV